MDFACIDINPFKLSYKIVRENSSEIYKGFGFKHLSDVTQYYMHPNNESYKGTTCLCQSIGEAVSLFAQMFKQMLGGRPFGNYYYDEHKDYFYLELQVPEEYHNNGVIAGEVKSYRVGISGFKIKACAYNHKGDALSAGVKPLEQYYKLLPVFLILLARDAETIPGFKEMLEDFVENPAVDSFIRLHEDFYQNNKLLEYTFAYGDFRSKVNKENLISWAEAYGIVDQGVGVEKEPQKEAEGFSLGSTAEEQQEYMPQLAMDLVLPKELESICSAVAAGDVRSVLFHGPTGSGKTFSCKLLAQNIGLPIMEIIYCTENLDSGVLGRYITLEGKNIFQESNITKAIRQGGVVVFENINFAQPQHLAFLNSLLDENGFVRLANGTIVKGHSNFRFFATMNVGYLGTKALNDALYNRFQSVVEIAALSDKAIRKMLVERVPQCAAFVDRLLGVYHELKGKIEAERLEAVISPRNLENWARLAKYEGYFEAAEKTMLPIAKGDRGLEEAIRGIIRLYLIT